MITHIQTYIYIYFIHTYVCASLTVIKVPCDFSAPEIGVALFERCWPRRRCITNSSDSGSRALGLLRLMKSCLEEVAALALAPGGVLSFWGQKTIGSKDESSFGFLSM